MPGHWVNRQVHFGEDLEFAVLAELLGVLEAGTVDTELGEDEGVAGKVVHGWVLLELM